MGGTRLGAALMPRSLQRRFRLGGTLRRREDALLEGLLVYVSVGISDIEWVKRPLVSPLPQIDGSWWTADRRRITDLGKEARAIVK